MTIYSLAFAGVFLIMLNMTSTGAQFAPDTLIVNAVVRTLDPGRPRAEAVAVFGNRIVAVGTTREMVALKSPSTKLIDARGHLVLPGFNDAHVHFLAGGFQLSNIDLRSADSPNAMAKRLADFAGTLSPGRWITGGDWDHERWPGAPLPTSAVIDASTPHNPVFVSRLDGHMALANSLALQLAGVDKNTPDPAGGEIVRDAHGNPTGILKDAAMGLVSKLIPAPAVEDKMRAAMAATRHAASLGVTSVQDMSAGSDVAVYHELLRRGELRTRIYAVAPLPAWETLARPGLRVPFGNPMLRMGGLKGFSDGSLGSTTALFFEPYDDAPQTRGLPSDEMVPQGAMLNRVQGADHAGLQVMIHAIGDCANDQILTLFETVAESNGSRDRRFRIEHAQHLRAVDIPRFSRGKVVASMQPYHAADDGRWAEKRIGPRRAQTTYAFRALLTSGARLAFGSDWTVAPLNPLLGIQAAVTRRTLDGKHPQGWIPDQKISVEQAVSAYTAGAAYAEFQDDIKGTITPGKLADLIMLDRDIFEINPIEIEQARVVWTMVDGKLVWPQP